jgi:hypothetical protein
MKYLFNKSYSGKRERHAIKKHLSHYPRRILTGLCAGLTVFITLALITLYLIITN